jgi:hypothetical protein
VRVGPHRNKPGFQSSICSCHHVPPSKFIIGVYRLSQSKHTILATAVRVEQIYHNRLPQGVTPAGLLLGWGARTSHARPAAAFLRSTLPPPCRRVRSSLGSAPRTLPSSSARSPSTSSTGSSATGCSPCWMPAAGCAATVSRETASRPGSASPPAWRSWLSITSACSCRGCSWCAAPPSAAAARQRWCGAAGLTSVAVGGWGAPAGLARHPRGGGQGRCQHRHAALRARAGVPAAVLGAAGGHAFLLGAPRPPPPL